MDELKNLIKTRRLQIGKTLEQIGNEVGVSKATVYRWESGNIKDMRRSRLVALADALDVEPSYLMGWDNSTNGEPALKNEDGLSEMDVELINLLCHLTPDEIQRVRDFVSGILSAR